MPDKAGNFKGISTASVKNRWLEEVSIRNSIERHAREIGARYEFRDGYHLIDEAYRWAEPPPPSPFAP